LISIDHHQQSDRLLGATPDIASGFLEAREDESEPSMTLARLHADAAPEQPFQERTEESLLFKVLTE
jgi:hypothetical protein